MSYNAKQDEVARLLAPIEVVSGEQNIDVEETHNGSTTTFTVTVPTGTYYPFNREGPNHPSPSSNASPTWKTGYDGLYRDICNRLNANTQGATAGGGYQIEWVPPAAGSFSHPATVRLFHTDPNIDSFFLQNTGSGLPIKLFGHHPDDPQTLSTFGSSDDGNGLQEIVGRQTAWGVWTAPHIASFFRSTKLYDGEKTEVDFERMVSADWKEWIVRVVEYQRLPAIHVMSGRDRRPNYADVGELDWWDAYNALEEYWELIRDGQHFIVFWGTTWGGRDRPDGTQVDWPNANADIEVCDGNVSTSNLNRSTVEICRMFDESEMDDFREVAPVDANKSSEHYPAEWKLRCDPDQHFDY